MFTNFTGDTRRARQVNLGGRGRQTANRESLLKKAADDRRKREEARKQDEAAKQIQLYWRKQVQEVRPKRLALKEKWLQSPDSVQVAIYFWRTLNMEEAKIVLQQCSELNAAPEQWSELGEEVCKWIISNGHKNASTILSTIAQYPVIIPSFFKAARVSEVTPEALNQQGRRNPAGFVLDYMTQEVNWQGIDLINVVLDTICKFARLPKNKAVGILSNMTQIGGDKFIPALSVVLSSVPFGDIPEELLERLEPLYSVNFVTQILDKYNYTDVSQVLVSLLRIHPERKQQVLQQLSLIDNPPVARVLWKSLFESGPIQKLYRDSMSANEVSEFLESSQYLHLTLLLELYSYWLIVTLDHEFRDQATTLLRFSEIENLMVVLKNLCVAMITNEIECNLIIAVLRQVYARDSRRPFLPKGFWLVRRLHVDTSFIKSLVEEEKMRLSQEHGVETTASRRMASRPSLSAMRSRNRTILSQLPFFIPFNTRVTLFEAFKAEDHSNVMGSEDVFLMHHTGRMGIDAPVIRGREFESAYEKLYSYGSELKKPLSIRFFNDFGPEAGIDGGGLTKEFLTSVTDDAFNTSRGLFAATDNHLLYPNPTTHDTKQLAFLGNLVGKGLYENILIEHGFASFFLQKWTQGSMRSSIDDLYSLDPNLYESLASLKQIYATQGDADLGLTFSIDYADSEGNVRTRDLIRNGSEVPVTKANYLRYIYEVANFKLNTSIRTQTDAFLGGLYQLIDPSWVSMFNADELQMLISGGHANVDVWDLKTHTNYGGYLDTDQTIKDFWTVFESFEEEDKRLLLKFVTSVSKAPLQGFKALNPSFAIRNAGRQVDRFPTASTCVNLLKLPDYQDIDQLRKKLLYAIRSHAGFDLS